MQAIDHERAGDSGVGRRNVVGAVADINQPHRFDVLKGQPIDRSLDGLVKWGGDSHGVFDSDQHSVDAHWMVRPAVVVHTVVVYLPPRNTRLQVAGHSQELTTESLRSEQRSGATVTVATGWPSASQVMTTER